MSYYSRYFCFKDGFNFVVGSDKEMVYFLGDFGMVKLFFIVFT